ncbi:MAG: ATP-binding cassette domain-containing protein [Pseudomonadota bacterium]
MLEVSISGKVGAFSIDAQLEAGLGVTALFGPSGAGKSTVLRAIAGLWTPESGTIRVGERTLLASEEGIDVPVRKRRVGVVFQEPGLFPHYTVRKNLAYGYRGKSKSEAWDRIVALLDLAPHLERMPRTLSGGEMQRVALGRALLSDPSILLLDEPLTGLDEGRREQLLPFLERLRDEATVPIVYVSHHREEIVRLADLVFLMSDGRVTDELTPNELRKLSFAQTPDATADGANL